MSELDLLARVGLTAAIGLLIGIERGWQKREALAGTRVAGIRTFTLIGLLGGVAGLLPGRAPDLLSGLFFLGFALTFGAFEWRKSSVQGTLSATDLVAGLLTFALGTYAAQGHMAVAAAGGVVTAAVLAERRAMHAFLRNLTWIELRSALVLLMMTAVLLPALPDRTIDPWGALNPYQIWLMTVLAGVVSYAGYVSVRLAGPRGLLYAGAMGGMVTSTTVTWTFARLARRGTAPQGSVMGAVLAAWCTSLIRMTLLAGVVAPQLLRPLAGPVAASSLVLLAPLVWTWRSAGGTEARALALEDPFDLRLLLRFTVLLAVISLLAKLITGPSGLFALAGISGLLDVDPVTLSMARMMRTGLDPALATTTILIAASANGLAKSVLAVIFGGWRLGLMLGAAALAAFAAGAAAWLLLPG